MSDGDENNLDSLLTKNTNKNNEDAFASLLDEFITQNTDDNNKENKQESNDSLDSFYQVNQNNSDSNNENIDLINELSVTLENQTINASQEDEKELKSEEQDLARAITNFQDAIISMADKKNFKVPETDYKEEMLYPNYKPSTGQKIAQYLLSCWDIINRYDPENMKKLSKDADDEAYLTFAEGLTDTNMQLAIISYVEILINMEACEFNYKQKKEIAQKNKIKKELYDEYMELQERKAKFIMKLKEKNFPIDADKLINNYFRAAQNDASGAFTALTKNPAMFSPIDFDKIKPKFFGLIKVTPEDGIKANQKIGEFIKKLKV